MAVNPVSQEHSLASTHPTPFHKWGGLIILGLALSVVIIDTTLLNVSLKPIIVDLHTDLEDIQWVITIYSLILGAFTITGGRLGDIFGRRKMFVLGAILFAVGALIASLSHSINSMIIGESIIEGLGAALMLPATASLLIANYHGRDRAIAFGVWGGLAAASTAIGPVLGGWLATHYTWRWGFQINIVVVAILLLGTFLIKEGKRPKAPTIDVVGIILSSLGLLAITFAFLETSTYGWFIANQPLTLVGHTVNMGSFSVTPLFLTGGVALLGLFTWWEYYTAKRGHTPLVSLDLLRNRQFMMGTLTAAILFLSQSGLIFSIPVFLQAVKNYDALHTGLALLPMSVMLLISAPLSAFLSKYISARRLVQFGVLITLAGFGLVRYHLHLESGLWEIAPGFMLFGAGMGFIMAQVSNLTLSAVSEEEAGEAAGVNNTIRQIGSTLGSAIIGSILISSLAYNIGLGVNNSPVIPGAVKESIVSALKAQSSEVEFGSSARLSGPIEAPIREELTGIINSSNVVANRRAIAFGMVFLVFGFIASLLLKEDPGEKLAAKKDDTLLSEHMRFH